MASRAWDGTARAHPEGEKGTTAMPEQQAAAISVGTVQDAARVLKCIGHPVRLRIIELLDNGGERTVTEIREAIGLEQAAASQHLNLMRDKRILKARRDGVNVYYDISDEKVVRVIDCLRACDITNR
jgi:DNA-binding transcriptional ArsR family regulator